MGLGATGGEGSRHGKDYNLFALDELGEVVNDR